MSPGEIAFKCNFAFVDDVSKNVIRRKVDNNFDQEAIELCKYLQIELDKESSWLFQEEIKVTIKHATEHRCGIKIQKLSRSLSDRITGTDPLYDKYKLN